jgi:hypothetical protein
MLERIGNVRNFRKSNIGQTEVSKPGALTGGGRNGSYDLSERRGRI